jgi:acyl-CoA thioesterase
VNFLAPGQLGDTLVAEAREQALSGRSGVYQVTVTNQRNEKIAVFQGLSRAIGGGVLDEN